MANAPLGLKKKVLYLDQFAISNMMKALNPKTEAHQKGRVDEFWGELFQKVDRLIKLQLLVCPDSDIHSKESVLYGFPDNVEDALALRKLYYYLSKRVSFRHHKQVQQRQLCRHVKHWVEGREKEPISFDCIDAFYDNPHEWTDPLDSLIDANMEWSEEFVDELLSTKARVQENSEDFPKEWEFKEFAGFYGRDVLQNYYSYIQRFDNNIPIALDAVNMVHVALKEKGIAGQELDKKMREYFESEAIEYLPFNRIKAMLYASVAEEIRSNKKAKTKLDKALMNDINMIATYLPYCDAIFIDNKMHHYLRQNSLSDELKNYRCRIFSSKANKDDLLFFLNEIEESVSEAHKARVFEKYGKGCLEPNYKLFGSSFSSAGLRRFTR